MQNPEQQSPAAVQGFPSVEHVALSAAHVPPEQFWLQQSAFDAHAPMSAVQAGYAQSWPSQLPLQQSLLATQAAPSFRQEPPLPVKTPTA